MVIVLSEEIVGIIDDILAKYCAEHNFPVYATRALDALRKNEEVVRKLRRYYIGTDTSLSDFMDKRINEVALKGVTNENISNK